MKIFEGMPAIEQIAARDINQKPDKPHRFKDNVSAMAYADESALHYKYGEYLPDSHVAQQYLQQVFIEAVGAAEAKKFEVHIFRELNAVNAFNYAETKIVVGASVMRWVETKEELQALLLHEYTHAKKKHLRQQRSAGSKDLFESYGKSIGRSRLHEYEADLRPLFTVMQKRQLNPYGIVRLLERLSKHEDDSATVGLEQGADYAHGPTQDRALNAEGIFHYQDLKGISTDLTPVPEAIRTSIPVETSYTRFRFGLPANEPQQKVKDYERWAAEFARTLLPRVVLIALQEFAGERPPEGYTSQGIHAIVSVLEERLEKEIINPSETSGNPDALRMARIFAHEIGCDLRYVFGVEPQQRLSLTSKGVSRPGALAKNLYQEHSRADRGKENVIALCETLAAALSGWVPPKDLIGHHFLWGMQGRAADALFEEIKRTVGPIPTPEQAQPYLSAARTLGSALAAFSQTVFHHQSIQGEHAVVDDLMYRIKINSELHSAEEKIEKEQKNDEDKGRTEKLKERIYRRDPRTDEEPEWVETEDKEYKEIQQYEGDDSAEAKKKRKMIMMRNQPPQLSKAYSRLFDFEDSGIKIKNFEKELSTLLDGKPFGQQFEAMQKLLEDLVGAALKYGEENIQIADSASRHYSKAINSMIDHLNIFFLPFLRERFLASGKDLARPEDRFQFMQLAKQLTDTALFGKDGRIAYGSFEERGGVPAFVNPPEFLRALRFFDRFPDCFSEAQRLCGPELLGAALQSPKELVSLYKAAQPEYKGSFSIIAAGYARKHCATLKDFSALVQQMESSAVPMGTMIQSYQNHFAVVLEKYWDAIPTPLDREQAQELFSAAPYVRDVFLKQTLSAAATARLLEGKTPIEKIRLLLNDERAFDLGIIDTLVEQELTRQQEFAQCRGVLEKRLDKFIKDPPAAVGAAAVVSTMQMGGEGGIDVCRRMLSTANDVESLRRWIIEQVHGVGVEFAEELGDAEDDDEEVEAEEEEEDRIGERRDAALAGRTVSSDEVVQGLLNLTRIGKSVIVRRILTGKDGLVEQPQYREQFLRMLTESILQQGGRTELATVIDETIQALAKTAEWKPLFFALLPLLTERMLIPPRTQQGERKTRHWIADASTTEPWTTSWQWRFRSEEKITRLLERLNVLEAAQSQEKLSSIEFVTEIAQHTGALGVRFLQLLPQFIELSDADRDAFSRVYDDVYGQRKLNAVSVLEREWPTVWKEIAALEQRIGGGRS